MISEILIDTGNTSCGPSSVSRTLQHKVILRFEKTIFHQPEGFIPDFYSDYGWRQDYEFRLNCSETLPDVLKSRHTILRSREWVLLVVDFMLKQF